MNEIANALGIPPAALPLILFAIYLVCKTASRLIPDTATGTLGTIRNIAGIVSVDISSRIAPGITIASVAAAAAATPPVSNTVEAVTGATPPVPTKE